MSLRHYLGYKEVKIDGYANQMVADYETPTEWKKISISIINSKWASFIPVEYRTKYLTREQIEAEGWIFNTDQAIMPAYPNSTTSIYYKDLQSDIGIRHAQLWHIHDAHIVRIQIKNGARTEIEFWNNFSGRCPSINEFRKICQWVGVTK